MKTAKNTTEDLAELYAKTDSFISDMAFFKDDITFLGRLLDRYFRKMIRIENLDELRECVMRFQNLNFSYDKLVDTLGLHRSKLLYAIDRGSKEKEPLVRDHSNLSIRMQQFTTDHRNIRAEIFSIANDVLEEEKEQSKVLKRENLFFQN